MVMNKKKQVFGVVENAEENKDYTGVKTKTANVTVDNINREISVDVDFSNMLGETNQTAYPGHLGAQTRRFVLKTMDEVASEVTRAKEAEDRLEELISDTTWEIAIGDSEIRSKLYDEIDRSKLAEAKLQRNIDNLDKATNSKLDDIQTSVVMLSDEVIKQDTLIREEITEAKDDLLQKINTTDTQLSKRIDAEVATLDNKIDDVAVNLETKFNDQLIEFSEDVHANIEELQSEIQDSNMQNQESIQKLQTDIKQVREDYAEKTYVYEKLVEFTKLSKQVVDYVDEKNNVVIIEGSIVTPVDGIIYLVKDSSEDVADVYREYTTIDGLLTLIGDTSTNLEGYATEEYVHKTVDSIDLTPYAKKDELPTKLSQFENDSDYATTFDVESVLLKFEFIDGGTSASILK